MYGLRRSLNVHSAFVSVAAENFLRWRSSHSLAIAENVSALAIFSALRFTAGSTPEAISLRASSRLTRIFQRHVWIRAKCEHLLCPGYPILQPPTECARGRDEQIEASLVADFEWFLLWFERAERFLVERQSGVSGFGGGRHPRQYPHSCQAVNGWLRIELDGFLGNYRVCEPAWTSSDLLGRWTGAPGRS
jgi:hypothetical protein